MLRNHTKGDERWYATRRDEVRHPRATQLPLPGLEPDTDTGTRQTRSGETSGGPPLSGSVMALLLTSLALLLIVAMQFNLVDHVTAGPLASAFMTAATLRLCGVIRQQKQ